MQIWYRIVFPVSEALNSYINNKLIYINTMEIIKTTLTKEQAIIKTLFKDFLAIYNSRSISKVVDMTHAGAFKILKRLEKRGIVISRPIGKAITYTLNFNNPVTRKEVEMVLVLEAQQHTRWLSEFKKLENNVQCVVLFGSILVDEKKAKDVDLLVVTDKENIEEVQAIIKERNEVAYKKIHLLLQLPQDFKNDIVSKNKVIVEIIKTGVVLFGQENIQKYLTR